MIIEYSTGRAEYTNLDYLVLIQKDSIGNFRCIFLSQLNIYTFLEKIGSLVEENRLNYLKPL